MLCRWMWGKFLLCRVISRCLGLGLGKFMIMIVGPLQLLLHFCFHSPQSIFPFLYSSTTQFPPLPNLTAISIPLTQYPLSTSTISHLTNVPLTADFFKIAFRPVPLFFYPAVCWATLCYGTSVTWLGVFGVTLAQVFGGPQYNFTAGQIGLIGLSPWIFGVIGTLSPISFPSSFSSPRPLPRYIPHPMCHKSITNRHILSSHFLIPRQRPRRPHLRLHSPPNDKTQQRSLRARIPTRSHAPCRHPR